MPELTNEFFALRDAETFQIHEHPPASLAARVLAVMVRSVTFPEGPATAKDRRGLPVESASILAAERTSGEWKWVTLSPATKEVIGDFLFDTVKVERDRWFYLEITQTASPPPWLEGAALIRDERLRQIEVEGFGPDRDAQYTKSELVSAAMAYASYAGDGDMPAAIGLYWPESWADEWFKPSKEAVRNLTKAGALIAAEIDRLQASAD
jgi:hypothetical protein